jgi:exopolysaccharide production protein ExoZ
MRLCLTYRLLGGGRDFSLLSSFLLLPADGPPALSVAWTLVHELMFYAVFTLFFLSWRWLAGGLAVWLVVILVANTLYTPTGWLRYPLSLLNIEFMLRVGAAWFVRRQGLRSNGTLIATLGVIAVGLALWLMAQNQINYFRLLFAMGLAVMVIGFALYEQSKLVRWPTLLLMLGNASYSIYLIHNPLLSITQRVAGRISLTWPLAMLWGVVLSVLAGLAYHRIVERPALQLFHKRLRA